MHNTCLESVMVSEGRLYSIDQAQSASRPVSSLLKLLPEVILLTWSQRCGIVW
jgi:hypothetical protein